MTKKFIARLVCVGILWLSPVFAEKNGYFVGAQLGNGGVSIDYEYCQYVGFQVNYIEQICTADSQGFRNFKYGFLGGYQHFLTSEFGLRFYGVFNAGKYKYDGVAYEVDSPKEIRTTFTNKLSERALNFNVDILYNLVSSQNASFSIFGGLSVGCVWYKYDMNEGVYAEYKEEGYRQIDKTRKLDIGLNFGLRLNIIDRHNIELYSRFALGKQQETYVVKSTGRLWTSDASGSLNTQYRPVTLTHTPMRNIGIRYIFIF